MSEAARPTETPAFEDRHRKDFLAARVLEDCLGEGALPPYIPGEPSGMAASHLAARAAPHILAELSRIYGVATWDIQTFQRFFLEGALRAWKPGTRVARIGGALCVISPDCPLRSQALRDPRVCHVCRLVQVLVTKTALGEAASDVGFEQLVTKGADACVLVIRRRPPDEAGPA